MTTAGRTRRERPTGLLLGTPVTVADFNARIQAAKLLIEQTAGRPSSNEPTKPTELERRFEAVTSEALRAMSSEELHAYRFWVYASRPDPQAFMDEEAELQAELKAAVAEGGDVAGRVIAVAGKRRAENGEAALTSEQKTYLREVYGQSNKNNWRHV